jgi:hypothetical protein
MCLLKSVALALMEVASFCAGVRRKRYNEQQVPGSYKKTQELSHSATQQLKKKADL